MIEVKGNELNEFVETFATKLPNNNDYAINKKIEEYGLKVKSLNSYITSINGEYMLFNTVIFTNAN